jgi:4-hydroxy-3-polyprenylbenzoate decarboxylase
MYDLREFIEKCKELGECKEIDGADWNLEIGAIAQWQVTEATSPLLVFDNIKGYPPGYRVCCNMYRTMNREALCLGLPLNAKVGVELVRAWREKVQNGVKPIPPVTVKSGPILENVHMGADIDLYEFPVPKWHFHDGGRYIGTGHVVITRDPEDGWINLGTYRVQVHEKDVATVFMSPGRHGGLMRQKYWAQAKGCPTVVSIGGNQALVAFGNIELPFHASEYDFAGWLIGKPVEVIEGPVTGLPIPANAEIAFEGEMLPPGEDDRKEGPFGEWPGYYGSAARMEPAFKVKSILHRNNPILQSAPPTLPSRPHYLGVWTRRAAELWADLDKSIAGIKGVYLLDEPLAGKMAVISVKQMFQGHAKQVALSAAGNRSIAYMCKWVMVVDDDIDPSNIKEVLWALCSRCEPAEDIDIARKCWGSALDPRLPPERKAKGDLTHSTAIIMAVKPYDWIDKYPRDIKLTPEQLEAVEAKWGNMFKK